MPPFPAKKTDYLAEALSRLPSSSRIERPAVVSSNDGALVIEADGTTEIAAESGDSLVIE